MADKKHLLLVLHSKAADREDVRAGVHRLRERGHQVDVRVTWEEGDCERIVAAAMTDSKPDILVAGGGDGTLNTVIAAALKAQPHTQTLPGLAVLPLGTANDFARGLGLPVDDIQTCLRIAAEGRPQPLDLATANHRPFVNMLTAGFGAKVTTETDPGLKKILGGAAYLFTGLHRFSQLSPLEGKISADDFEWEGRFLALAIGNGRQAGGGVQLCPDARIDDGVLDLTLLPVPEQLELGPMFRSLLESGPASLRERVIRQRITSAHIETTEALQANLDGEPMHGTHLDITLHPGQLTIMRRR